MAKPSYAPKAKRLRLRDESGLWHRPELLNPIADLLLLFAGIAFAIAVTSWLLSRPFFQLKTLTVISAPEELGAEQIEYAARTSVTGNFFTVDLDAVRQRMGELPWVYQAEVRRLWPDTLEVRLHPQTAVAYWTSLEGGAVQLLNPRGEAFDAVSTAPLPALLGPQGMERQLLTQHHAFSATLAPLGAHLVDLSLSARGAWRLKLDNGMVILLGRDQNKASLAQRLGDFVEAWPKVTRNKIVQIDIADLRYQNGFALTGNIHAAEDNP